MGEAELSFSFHCMSIRILIKIEVGYGNSKETAIIRMSAYLKIRLTNDIFNLVLEHLSFFPLSSITLQIIFISIEATTFQVRFISNPLDHTSSKYSLTSF